jgi:hypothetical protein
MVYAYCNQSLLNSVIDDEAMDVNFLWWRVSDMSQGPQNDTLTLLADSMGTVEGLVHGD